MRRSRRADGHRLNSRHRHRQADTHPETRHPRSADRRDAPLLLRRGLPPPPQDSGRLLHRTRRDGEGGQGVERQP